MIAGGFPCLGLSAVGTRRGLYGDQRSNLVKHVFRLVGELKPSQSGGRIAPESTMVHALREAGSCAIHTAQSRL
eukprot:5051999-Pyramimonas_sp.AAC.1